jgi:hypothetical protein
MAYFFPVIFALPLFGGSLARHWLWTFTPSLSYVGQGVLDSSPSVRHQKFAYTGIIMGFPTTLSMNFVGGLI